jgi:hypothetical protein
MPASLQARERPASAIRPPSTALPDPDYPSTRTSASTPRLGYRVSGLPIAIAPPACVCAPGAGAGCRNVTGRPRSPAPKSCARHDNPSRRSINVHGPQMDHDVDLDRDQELDGDWDPVVDAIRGQSQQVTARHRATPLLIGSRDCASSFMDAYVSSQPADFRHSLSPCTHRRNLQLARLAHPSCAVPCSPVPSSYRGRPKVEFPLGGRLEKLHSASVRHSCQALQPGVLSTRKARARPGPDEDAQRSPRVPGTHQSHHGIDATLREVSGYSSVGAMDFLLLPGGIPTQTAQDPT